MPNSFKYSTELQTLSLKKGNFYIGVGDVDKGPTSTTGYYNGITPPAGGYTIYLNKSSGGPSIFVANNDTELVGYTNQFSRNQTNYISNGGNFANGTISPFNNNYSDSGGVGQVVSISNDLPYVGSQSTNALYLNYNGGRWMSTVGLLTTGVTYTFSFWGKIISGSSFTVSWNNQNGSGDTNAWTSSTNLTTSWQRYTQTFTYNTAKNNFYFSSRSADTSRAAVFTEFQVTTGTTYGGPGLQNATECLRWYAAIPNDAACVNRDYESIITNGLLLNVDAGFSPSYGSTGNTWYDISYYVNDGALTNGPTYNSTNGGSLVFDGVDDYINWSNNPISAATSQFTYDAWFKFSGTIFNSFTISSSTYKVYFQNNNYWYMTGSQFGNVNVGWTYNNSVWVNFVHSYDGTNHLCYINGVQYTVNSGGGLSSQANLQISGRSSGSLPFRGNMAITRFYNRALSITEILQNYNAQKSRFGL